ncbi:hypothetical protein AcV5_000932 [Taiwanofungus camphoratus]|nr:hypothetical protein AcW2_006445 [Antrodia cinnamomea]KAI0939551.1 hypothetical protein AcV5_000932 [Antrodia cinnamomea]KAI0952467.1 hypothetical protein AcV7_008262 [Antrodia cinnamomea]
MPRFRCPSASPDPIGSSTKPAPSHQPRFHVPIDDNGQSPGTTDASKSSKQSDMDREKRKLRKARNPRMTAKERERLRMAYKKDQVRRIVKQQPWSFVFVGNLDGSITPQMLEDTFKVFGTISRIQLRASMGAGVTMKPARRTPGRQYASVEFSDTSAARRALAFNGQILNGVKLVVCLSAADLPETRDIVREHMARRMSRPGNVWKERFGALKRLTVDRTQPNLAEDLPEHAGPSNADPSGSSRRSGRRSGLRFSNVARQPTRHSAMGVSFATTLM